MPLDDTKGKAKSRGLLLLLDGLRKGDKSKAPKLLAITKTKAKKKKDK